MSCVAWPVTQTLSGQSATLAPDVPEHDVGDGESGGKDPYTFPGLLGRDPGSGIRRTTSTKWHRLRHFLGQIIFSNVQSSTGEAQVELTGWILPPHSTDIPMIVPRQRFAYNTTELRKSLRWLIRRQSGNKQSLLDEEKQLICLTFAINLNAFVFYDGPGGPKAAFDNTSGWMDVMGISICEQVEITSALS
ncbi:hypothetical protein B0H13DRAFT_1910017 [Mycena leptocephala]|nr:hypothetical protein B0H13DRAFT_1910017 [Mycena leptocephala]